MNDNKNHDIEVLRTLAIVFVILAHIAALLSPESAYWKILDISKFGSGVDLFFCVSGFIIAKSILDQIPKDRTLSSFLNFSLPFWVRRFWRLIPSAFLWVSISVVLSILWGGNGVFLPIEVLYKSAFAAVTQTSNFYFSECRPLGACGDLGIYWSLSLENQFYLLLPVIAFLMPRKLIYFFVAVFIAQFFLPRTLNASTPFMWALRTDAIALGVIIAILNKRIINSETIKSLNGRINHPLPIFIILTILLAIFASPKPIVFFSVGLTALLSGVFVLIASMNINVFSSNMIVRKVCDYIGSRSYSIYLTHVVMISVVKSIFFNEHTDFSLYMELTYISLFLALTLIFSELNYRFIEVPFRKYGKAKSIAMHSPA
ncbi:O-acetyltransferase OatA [Serratia plymuthica]|uniref:acyltransferase family protein n=1 Tax=Serratia plymuthica TaxID=82996 RepID=UPI000346E25B|nr:acyltransferase [Serratia plymuthica]QJW55504.1 O-acetyltransferase OatA [Serratia plymuthica]